MIQKNYVLLMFLVICTFSIQDSFAQAVLDNLERNTPFSGHLEVDHDGFDAITLQNLNDAYPTTIALFDDVENIGVLGMVNSNTASGDLNEVGNLFLGTFSDKPLTFLTSGSERMRIANDGKIGIGAATASHQLTVTASDAETMRLIGPGLNGAGSRFNFGDGDFVYIDEPTDDKLVIHASGGVTILDKLILGNAGEEYAGYQVSIDGKVACEEVRIEMSGDWPDYVFAKDYSLLPLETVEEHIQTEQHLPGIPSAAEIDNEGLQVGEMNRLLLEKVEELTLYTIQQDKQIKALLELAKTQQAQIDALTIKK